MGIRWILPVIVLVVPLLAACVGEAELTPLPQKSAGAEEPAIISPTSTSLPTPAGELEKEASPALIPTPTVPPPPPLPFIPTAQPTPPSEPTPGAASLDFTLGQLLLDAWQDLAQRLDVSQEDISVVSSQIIQWRNAALGCPEPGNVYAQVVTPGFRFVLSYGGQEYHYHSDNDGPPFLCSVPENPLISIIQ